MNLDTYKKQLIQIASRLNGSYFASRKEVIIFKNKIENFLDENYEIYVNATTEERNEIRQIIKDYDRSEKDVFEGGPPAPFRYALNLYGIRAIKQLEETDNVIWLWRGLVAISMLDGIHYQPDDELHLAHLYVAAEKKGINPNLMFQTISKISNNEPTKSGQISTSELVINLSCDLPKEIDAASEYKESDLDFKTSGSDSMNGFW